MGNARVTGDIHRLALALLVVVTLVLVVGAGAGAIRPHSGDIGDTRWLRDAAASVLAIAALALTAAAAYAFWPDRLRRRRRDPRPPFQLPTLAPWWQRVLAGILPLLLALVIVGLLSARHAGPIRPLPPQPVPTSGARPGGSPPGSSEPIIDWWAIAAAVTVAGAAAAVALGLQRRSRGQSTQPPPDRRRELIEQLDESLDSLAADPDTRRAVIAAYARMERWLAQAGVPRQPWETPFEYLDRVLVELGAPAAIAATLTELFERAKFAPHPVADATKRKALDVLVELRAELDRAA
jgi:hypothetical protein